jgi:hypothetical protein
MSFAIQDGVVGAPDLYISDNIGGGPYSLVGSNAGKMGRYAYPSVFVDAVDAVFGGGFFTYAQVAPITAQTISSITVSAGIATVTTGSAHGLLIGSPVQLAGVVPSAYNGIWQIATVPSGTTFTINMNFVWDQRWSFSNPNIVNNLAANGNIPIASATTVGTYVPGIGAGQVVQFTHGTDTFGNLILKATLWTGAANSGLSLGVALGNPLAYTTSSTPANPFGGQYGWFQVGGAMCAYTAGAPAIGNQTFWSSNGLVTPAAVASKQCQGTQYASAVSAQFGSGKGLITLPSNVAVVWGTFPLAQGAIT